MDPKARSLKLTEIFQLLKPLEHLISPELMDQVISEVLRNRPKPKPLMRADEAQHEWREYRDVPFSNVRDRLRSHTIVQVADDPGSYISPELEGIVGKPLQVSSYPPELPKPYWR